MYDSLQPHEPQHARPPCPSSTPGVYTNSCPLSRWYHPTISSSVIPFSSHLQSFPESGSFPMSQFFTSGGQSTGVLASASVLPVNIQDWFPLWLKGLISLLSKGLSRIFSNATVQKHQFFGTQLSLSADFKLGRNGFSYGENGECCKPSKSLPFLLQSIKDKNVDSGSVTPGHLHWSVERRGMCYSSSHRLNDGHHSQSPVPTITRVPDEVFLISSCLPWLMWFLALPPVPTNHTDHRP